MSAAPAAAGMSAATATPMTARRLRADSCHTGNGGD
jgi:hypothetical protein